MGGCAGSKLRLLLLKSVDRYVHWHLRVIISKHQSVVIVMMGLEGVVLRVYASHAAWELPVLLEVVQIVYLENIPTPRGEVNARTVHLEVTKISQDRVLVIAVSSTTISMILSFRVEALPLRQLVSVWASSQTLRIQELASVCQIMQLWSPMQLVELGAEPSFLHTI